MAEYVVERDLIADLRARLAEGLCLCSSAHTNWRGVEAILDRLEQVEACEKADERECNDPTNGSPASPPPAQTAATGGDGRG